MDLKGPFSVRPAHPAPLCRCHARLNMIFVRGTPPLFSVGEDLNMSPLVHEFAGRDRLLALTQYNISLNTDYTLELAVKLLNSPPSLGYQILFEAGGAFDGFSLSISPRHQLVFSVCAKSLVYSAWAIGWWWRPCRVAWRFRRPARPSSL